MTDQVTDIFGLLHYYLIGLLHAFINYTAVYGQGIQLAYSPTLLQFKLYALQHYVQEKLIAWPLYMCVHYVGLCIYNVM